MSVTVFSLGRLSGLPAGNNDILCGRHCSSIDVHVRIDLDRRDVQSSSASLAMFGNCHAPLKVTYLQSYGLEQETRGGGFVCVRNAFP